MSIYIAWGEETLGPYSPAELDQLVKCGCLLPEDYAARDGDAAWRPVSSFLTMETAPERAPATPVASPANRRSRRPWLLAAVLALALLVAGLTPRLMRVKNAGGKPVARASREAASTPVPDVKVKPAEVAPSVAPIAKVEPVANTPNPPSPPSPPVEEHNSQPGGAISPAAPEAAIDVARPAVPEAKVEPASVVPSPPPTEAHGVRLGGTASLSSPDASPVPLGLLPVRVYPLKDLEPYVARKQAAAQTELARLAPLAEAAEAERNARVAAEQSARQTFLATNPSDPLYSAMRFAHQQARGAIKTADDDCRYYHSLRKEVTGGNYYLEDLPAPLATVETNERGEFAFDLPSAGPFVVVACTRQTTATGSLMRYWMVKVAFTDADQKTVALSESNTTAVASADSLVQTED